MKKVGIISVVCAAILSCGLSYVGYFSVKNSMGSKNLVEVKGLAERVVKADCANVEIKIKRSAATMKEALTKSNTDKEKFWAEIQKLNFSKKELLRDETSPCDDTESRYVDGKWVRDPKFSVISEIEFHLTDMSKVEQLSKIIDDFLKRGVLIEYSYSYSISDFNSIKLDLMKEAAMNARKVAEAFISPLGRKLGDVVYLNQGTISVSSPYENANNDGSGYYEEQRQKKSIDKKLRLVVRAGFKQTE